MVYSRHFCSWSIQTGKIPYTTWLYWSIHMKVDEKSSPTCYMLKVFTLSKKYPHDVEKTLVSKEKVFSQVFQIRSSFLWSNPFTMNIFLDICLTTLEGSKKKKKKKKKNERQRLLPSTHSPPHFLGNLHFALTQFICLFIFFLLRTLKVVVSFLTQ